ncbi:helix-turn-helix domain-containing protein [Sphingopyxis indica]|uniref:helix-turn-helix domain-containing protein n=1 Tax=Sphingopyxis indica TaxID=436663 RepID=UPI002938EE79|nr:helix-turn-helix domain-containing protein [Sphingopyxis indica]WOF44550.1 helix-turn-helix domain-containing protein [Sphingopyxis indica]
MTESEEIARARCLRRGSPFLSNDEAAAFLGLGPRTLQELRARGKGPASRRHARFVRYHIDDLVRWSRTTIFVESLREKQPEMLWLRRLKW